MCETFPPGSDTQSGNRGIVSCETFSTVASRYIFVSTTSDS